MNITSDEKMVIQEVQKALKEKRKNLNTIRNKVKA